MYKLTPEAIKDISKIYEYTIKNFGVVQADKYHRNLFSTFSNLDKQPETGKDGNTVMQNLKTYHVKSHIVVYSRQSGGIEIDRILHKSMDYKRHF